MFLNHEIEGEKRIVRFSFGDSARRKSSTDIRLLPLVATQGNLSLRAISRARTPICGICRNRVFAELPQRLWRAGIPREVFIHQGNPQR